MVNEKQLLRYDALQEIANIGGGHAATSLSKMIGKRVGMDVPFLRLLPYDEVFAGIQSDETVVRAVLSEVVGQEYGVFLFVIPLDESDKLAELLLPEEVAIDFELANSAIKELSNILVQSFLQAVMQMINKPLIASLPSLTVDLFGSILSSVYMEQYQFSDEIFIMKNKFYSMGHVIEGSLYFVPKPTVLEKLLDELGI
ncbi:chemotaxis protein CheC [Alkalibacterium iburiense]|uniref:Chemotaxis protein CheC n=1 Tax=Alkalibacterium iburiense TaxID=290589 RepID=A0ABN0XNW1_9LACT